MSMISKFYEGYLLTEDTNNPKQSALNSFLSSHMSDRNDIIEADGLLSAALDESSEAAFYAGFKTAMKFMKEVLA